MVSSSYAPNPKAHAKETLRKAAIALDSSQHAGATDRDLIWASAMRVAIYIQVGLTLLSIGIMVVLMAFGDDRSFGADGTVSLDPSIDNSLQIILSLVSFFLQMLTITLLENGGSSGRLIGRVLAVLFMVLYMLSCILTIISIFMFIACFE